MKELREQINQALKSVTLNDTPTVYEAIQSNLGYKNIEDRIINTMIDNGVTASAAIPQIERML
jgi:hypothetical protein